MQTQTQPNSSYSYADVCFLCNTKQLLCERGPSFAYSTAHARGCSLGHGPGRLSVCVCVCVRVCAYVRAG